MLVLERCDSVVWLDLPRWQIWSQVVRRTLLRIVRRDELFHGNKESLRIMLSRDSIIWWSVRTFSKRREQYNSQFADPAYLDRVRIRLRSRQEVDEWLASLSTHSPEQLT
jgi:adenylate kinase family enzyme